MNDLGDKIDDFLVPIAEWSLRCMVIIAVIFMILVIVAVVVGFFASIITSLN